jgi:hypothetical protein
MKPTQALMKDWRMYYNDTYMMHKDLGVVRIKADMGTLRAIQVLEPYEEHYVKGKDLEVWWPRAGAYNHRRNAYYVARRAHRCMKKSCVPGTHYYCKWGRDALDGGEGPYVKAMAQGQMYVPMKVAMEHLDAGLVHSRAVSTDIILTKKERDGAHGNDYAVIFRGQRAGIIRDREYIPNTERHPSTKLILNTCYREGIW